ncbi:hypothetical protein BJY01DRAFT_253201 [Aspergillus pseudoustus]|uniref:C2H2-type domain-containing protein n=1 Tax=Aspergillus pseudoustus TaxID=1810923 RepID=A0ABR4J2A5_9EURO
MERLPSSSQNEDEDPLPSILPLTTTAPYLMPCLATTSQALYSPVPLAAAGSTIDPAWGGNIPSHHTMSSNIVHSSMLLPSHEPSTLYNHQLPSGFPTWPLDNITPVYLNRPSGVQQPHAPILNPPNNTAIYQTPQTMNAGQLSPYRSSAPTPVTSFYCKWEGCQCPIAFKRLPDIIRHIREIHLVPDAYRCPVDGCGRTFKRSDRLRQHERTHHPQTQALLVQGLRF